MAETLALQRFDTALTAFLREEATVRLLDGSRDGEIWGIE